MFSHFAFLVVASAATADPLTPEDFHPFDPAKAAIGQLLFYDPILSGNKNISCATCHHPAFGTSDGLSLGIGEGGIGMGPTRSPGHGPDRIAKRIPRNAQALWNVGAKAQTVMFHDGRLSTSEIYGNRFNSPAEEWLPEGLPNILAAQALFPMTSQFEMAGNPKENEVAGAIHDRIDAAWPIIAKRVRGVPAYLDQFEAAFGTREPGIVEIGIALADFMNSEFQSFDSRYDQWLQGKAELTDQEAFGLDLFNTKFACNSCHRGNLFTDFNFHNLALPQFGPGRTRRFDPVARDVGRMGESDRLEDAYRFRTPSLRNVTLTAPYGHNGAYARLEDIIRHHLDPLEQLKSYTPEAAHLTSAPWIEKIDFVAFRNLAETARLTRQIDVTPTAISDAELSAIVAFLGTLTGTASIKGRLGSPAQVPSGLPVDQP